MDLTATLLMAVLFLASPFLIDAARSPVEKLSEDPIKCTPCIQNPPPPPSCSSPPPPPPKESYFPPPPPPSCSSPPPPPPKESYFPPPPPKESYFPPPPPPPPTYEYPSPLGDLYPVDHDFGAAAGGEIFTNVQLIALVVICFMIL